VGKGKYERGRERRGVRKVLTVWILEVVERL